MAGHDRKPSPVRGGVAQVTVKQWKSAFILFSIHSCGENFVKFLIHKIFHHYPGEEKRSKLFLYMNKVEMYVEISVEISITSWG